MVPENAYQCEVSLTLPLEFVEHPGLTPTYWTIAKFNYDPGLQVGDAVDIADWTLGVNQEFTINCKTEVMQRVYQIIPNSKGGKIADGAVFKLVIVLEAPDKEDYPIICEAFRKLNPGKFVYPDKTISNSSI